MKSKILLSFLILIVFILGFLANSLFLAPKDIIKKEEIVVNDNYQTGWKAAQERLLEMNLLPYLTEKIEINSVYGKITEINDNELKVKIIPIDLITDMDFKHRIVKITENTEIVRKIKKDDKEYQEEMRAFMKDKGDLGPEYGEGVPSIFYEEKVQLTDLKVDQNIFVEAGENIKEKEVVIAEKITTE